MPVWGTILLAAGSFLGALATAVAVIRKLGPEVDQIQIQSANNIVAMAETTAQMSKSVADDLRARNEKLDDRVTELSRLIGKAQQEITDLREQTADIEPLRRKVAELSGRLEEVTREKNMLDAENRHLRDRVAHLTEQVHHLESEVDRLRRIESDRYPTVPQDEPGQDQLDLG